MGSQAELRFSMAPPAHETPRDAFVKLRQGFDALKEKHTDPWCWHEYLGEEKKDEDDGDPDPEKRALKPKKRSNVDRLKAHLLTSIAELNRCAAAADMAYFHMCTSPEEQRECTMVLGSSGDVDEELLAESGDASPAKIMAALQKKLDKAKERIKELEEDIKVLESDLQETRRLAEERWENWQTTAVTLEEALTRLHWTTIGLNDTLHQKGELQEAYNDLHIRWVRASRMMLHKGRELMRDKIFRSHPKENMFYAYHGFMYILQKEKEERKRREEEARRDAVEFALRNEVRFFMGVPGDSEKRGQFQLTVDSISRLTNEVGRLKMDRYELSCRIMHKYRPYEDMEYCLWVFEWWLRLRPEIVLEKELETEKNLSAAVIQQLSHTSAQLPPAAKTIDKLKRMYAIACVDKDLARREITAETGRTIAFLIERLQQHRVQELAVLARLHRLDVEAKEERIAMLEREIAEDQHIHALKGMVVDLEGRLRRALDRRKQRGFVVPPGTGQKCVACGREDLFRNWKVMPRVADVTSSLSTSASDGDLPIASMSGPLAPLTDVSSVKMGSEAAMSPPWPPPSNDPKPKYLAVWR